MSVQAVSHSSVLSSVVRGGIGSSIITWAALKKDGAAVVIPHSDLNNVYFNFFKESVSPVFNRVISGLKKQKEHLALQLNFEFGNMSEEDFNRQEEAYLTEAGNVSVRELKRDLDILFSFSDVYLDSEEISEVFDCSVDVAEEALQLLLFEDKQDASL